MLITACFQANYFRCIKRKKVEKVNQVGLKCLHRKQRISPFVLTNSIFSSVGRKKMQNLFHVSI